MECPRCTYENPPDAVHCHQCGYPLQAQAAAGTPTQKVGASPGGSFCASCGAPIRPGARFCSRCGQPVSAPAQPAQPASVPARPHETLLETPPYPIYPPSHTFQAPPAAPKNRGGWGRFVLMAAALVLGVALVAFLSWKVIPRLIALFRPEATPTAIAENPDAVVVTGDLVEVPPLSVPPLTFADPAQAGILTVNVVLDASGSMNNRLPEGTLHRDAAAAALTAHLRSFPPATHLGLRVLGSALPWTDAESCQDVEQIAAPGPGQAEALATWLQDPQAQGATPLAEALRQAIADLPSDPARVTALILVTDGIDSCGQAPCEIVRTLRGQGPAFTLHVVGLDATPEIRTQLQCIATAGGGLYRDASSVVALSQALGEFTGAIAEAVAPRPTRPPETETPTTETPAITETPGPSPTPCLPDATFVSDLTVPDNTEFAPGAAFTKSWRVRSTGCAAWPAGTELIFVDGERMDAPASVAAPAPTAPEATADISVDMRAPTTPGTYRGTWQLRGPDGVLFGNRIYVQIVVPGALTLSFVADRTTIKRGECVTLSWSVKNAVSVLLNGQAVDAEGSRVECPLTTMTYELSAKDIAGNWQRANLIISVETGY